MASRASRATAGARIYVEKTSMEQLKSLKNQSDLEVNPLQDSLNNILTATIHLKITSNALNDLSLHHQGMKLLVPLTAFFNVPNTLDDADKVLVSVSTGYFIQLLRKGGKNEVLNTPGITVTQLNKPSSNYTRTGDSIAIAEIV